MRIKLYCPRCKASLPVDPADPGSKLECDICEWTHPISVSEAIADDKDIDVCVLCGNADFFKEKNFPPNLGCMVLVLAGVLVYVLAEFFKVHPLITYSPLAIALIIDVALVRMVKSKVVCYQCMGEYHDFEPLEHHKPYDLAHAAIYQPAYELSEKEFRFPDPPTVPFRPDEESDAAST